ncbi:MAG TPA: cytochrome c [Bryobacteraceae bacterium]|nr:cytochrome c [Bryobacteraceae bacterium]
MGARAADIAAVGVAVLSMMLLASAAARAQESHIGNMHGQAKKGEALYGRYCIGCHGERGDGAGENAPWVNPQFPKPRDFTAGLFKCRSTPSGSIPTDSDLFDTVSRGIDTTAMPQWFPLTRQDRADLVAYVKGFSPRFKEEQAEPGVTIPPESPSSPESVLRGKELYQKTLKCAECHGAEGRGDGPSAATLRDVKGNPNPPYDFTAGSRFKCGQSDQDLARIFLTGLDGTPMPTFADYLQGDQIWDLVHYLRSLQASAKSKSARERGFN